MARAESYLVGDQQLLSSTAKLVLGKHVFNLCDHFTIQFFGRGDHNVDFTSVCNHEGLKGRNDLGSLI